MTALVFNVPGANWANKGFPSLYPFVATDALEFGFDFRARTGMLDDFAGKHTCTPKKVDIVAGILNVTDPTIMVPVDDGMGMRLELGYLQCSQAAAAFALGGARQFTLLLAGRGGGVDFPADKMVGTLGRTASLFDYGSVVSQSGFSVDRASLDGRTAGRIENATINLSPEVVNKAITAPEVLFLTFDGTNWTLINKTVGVSISRTNTELAVGNPIAIAPGGTSTDNKVSLGGQTSRTTTSHGYYPVVYQRASWNRVLTESEMNEQYAKTKAGRPLLAL